MDNYLSIVCSYVLYLACEFRKVEFQGNNRLGRQVCELAEAESVESVIAASRGLGAVAGTILGSTSTSLIHVHLLLFIFFVLLLLMPCCRIVIVLLRLFASLANHNRILFNFLKSSLNLFSTTNLRASSN